MNLLSKLKQQKTVLFILVFLFTTPSFCYSSEQQQSSSIDLIIKRTLTADQHPYLDQNIFLAYKSSLEDLYYLSPQHLLWLNKDHLSDQNISAVFQLLSNAHLSGLNEEHYNVSFLTTKWQELSNQPANKNEIALLDTAISINLLHFLSDVKFGRIDPKTLKFNFESSKYSADFIPLILNSLQNHQINTLTENVEPKFPAYQKIKQALFDYRQKNAQQRHPSIDYQTSLKLGNDSSQIIQIRQQLSLLGIHTNNTGSIYDEELVELIQEFQLRHGLKNDGVIGKRTIKALNIPISERIERLVLALERFRWLPNIQAGPRIIINIPAYQLWAYNTHDNDSRALNMKVIVGKSVKTQSPVFSADMYYLEFSPYWNIPKSITRDEILPKLEENLQYLDQQNMEIVTGFHNKEQALAFDEDSIQQLKSGTLKLRQRPGKWNALGKVKFIFPNNYNVYLHDTPTQRLFNKSKRDFSHGCIRIEKPTALASFLLASKPRWNEEKIKSSMRLTQPKKVGLKKPVPVIIFYSTASAIEDKIYFYDDIYGYDDKLKLALIEHNMRYALR